MGIIELAELSRRYGADPDYVIAGGGNTSFKDDSTLYIKGSGTALGEIRPEDFVRMDRGALSRIWERSYPRDPAERESAVLADMMAARKPGEEKKRPSVETLLHDMLPFTYVVHTHPALVNGLTCSRDGERRTAELFEGEAIWIPSTNPGYILSLTVKEAMDAHTAKKGKPAALIFLQNHGVFAGAQSPGDIERLYGRIMELLGSHVSRKPDLSGGVSQWGPSERIAALLAELARGAARTAGNPDAGAWQAAFLRNREIAAMTADRGSFYPLSSAFTPDHIVYAGSDPLFVETAGNEADAVVAGVRAAWEDRLGKTGRIPKIAAVQGLGAFGIGASGKSVQTALALFADAVKVVVYAESFGGPRFMTEDQIDFINNWEVERYRANVAGTVS
jgi:rhamnose utilization protein RhaD (predicted bifunctional aldolase and dehydrogenase)